MDIGSSQHSGAFSSPFLGGSSHSYPYMPEIGDSSVKKEPKRPRGSRHNGRVENRSRDGNGLTVFGPPGSSPNDSNFPSVQKSSTAGNLPSGYGSPNERAQMRKWINPFCQEPENDSPTCCLGCWLPCCLYGKTQQRLLQISEGLDPLDETSYKHCDRACWGFGCVEIFGAGCIFAALDRTRIRAMYNIRGTLAGDIFTTICCARCALMQHDREIRAREKLATANGEKPKRNGTINDQPSRHPDLNYATSPFLGPPSIEMPHGSSLVIEKTAEANGGIKAQHLEMVKDKEYPKGNVGGNKLRKHPKIQDGGEECNTDGKDSTGPRGPEPSKTGEKLASNLSPLGSALNPITQSTKVDIGDRNDIISSRQPWRGHGMTIKPKSKSKPKQDSDQEMFPLASKASQHPIADSAGEEVKGNDNKDHSTSRRVVFKGSNDHSARIGNDSWLPKGPAVTSSQRRSSFAVANAPISDCLKDSTADESVLVYYSDGDLPQRHRVRDCARLRASTIGRPEVYREARVLSDCISDDATSTAEQPKAIHLDRLVEGSKDTRVNTGEAKGNHDKSDSKKAGPTHTITRVEAPPRNVKKTGTVSQHSLNDCVVEHVQTVAAPQIVQHIPQHHLAECIQAELVENTNVVNGSKHDTESAEISSHNTGMPSDHPNKDENRRGTFDTQQSRSGTTSTSTDGLETLAATVTNPSALEDTSQQGNSAIASKSPEMIMTTRDSILPEGVETTKSEGPLDEITDPHTERKPSEAALALRRVLREPIPQETSMSSFLDGTTDILENIPVSISRIKAVREKGKRTAPY